MSNLIRDIEFAQQDAAEQCVIKHIQEELNPWATQDEPPKNAFVDKSENWESPLCVRWFDLQRVPGYWSKFHATMKIPSNQN